MGIYNNIYSGAGTIILEEINGVLCLLLGEGKRSQKYSDFGGTYEKKDGNIANTAKRELQEESMNLFNIDKKYFVHYVDVPTGEYKYRAYIIKVNNIKRKYFCHNKNILEKNKAPRYWLEMSDIAHFPLSKENIQNLSEQHKMISTDGDLLPLSYRCRIILLRCMRLILKQADSKPLMTRKHLIKNSSNDFTNNTFSFVK